jgi:ankyrin repeat protein
MGQARLIPWLVKNKVSPNIEDINGFTPFHRAAEIVGRRICMELLWEAGSKVNSLTVKGDTVLHVAAKRADRDTMKWLIEHGAKLHCYGCEKGRPCDNIENQTLKWVLEEFDRYKVKKKDIKKKLEDEKKKRKEEDKTKDWAQKSKEITDRMQTLQVEDKQRRRLSIGKKA